MELWDDYNLPCLRIGSTATGAKRYKESDFYYDFRRKRVNRGFIEVQCRVTLSRRNKQTTQFLKFFGKVGGEVFEIGADYQGLVGQDRIRFLAPIGQWRMVDETDQYVTVTFNARIVPKRIATRRTATGATSCPLYPSDQLYPADTQYPC